MTSTSIQSSPVESTSQQPNHSSNSNHLIEYFFALEAHDWTYVYSSDHDAYIQGQKESIRLRETAETCPRSLALYVAYSEHIYAGKPKPCMPTVLQSSKTQERQKFIKRFDAILEKLFTDPAVTTTTIARKLALSERQLFRKTRGILNTTPTRYLNRFRLNRAKSILDTGRSACFTTYETGFSSQSYFSKCFKKEFGLSPSDYKRAKLQIH